VCAWWAVSDTTWQLQVTTNLATQVEAQEARITQLEKDLAELKALTRTLGAGADRDGQ
jgi:hypothetical protein